MAKRPDPERRIIDAALKLAAETPWRAVTMEDIAAEANLSMDQLRGRFRSKNAVLAGLNRRLDEAMLKGTDKGADNSIRDQLFEMLMRRFDALQGNRDGVRSMLQGTVLVNPPATLMGACSLLKSMSQALEAAGVSPRGPLGRLKSKGLAAVYLTAARTWMTDDTEDLGPTMAALDRALRGAEQWATMFPGRRRAAADG